jgi:hypothetical protein
MLGLASRPIGSASALGDFRSRWGQQACQFVAGRRRRARPHSTVEAVVKTCFDGLYEGDADKLGAAFHRPALGGEPSILDPSLAGGSHTVWAPEAEIPLLTVKIYMPKNVLG